MESLYVEFSEEVEDDAQTFSFLERESLIACAERLAESPRLGRLLPFRILSDKRWTYSCSGMRFTYDFSYEQSRLWIYAVTFD